MDTLTITEALAELKTLGKRLEKKRQSILPYLWRQEGLKDPLEKDGGSAQFIQRERQAIRDLEERIIAIRITIQATNQSVGMTIGDRTRSIAGWLTWRKEVAKDQAALIESIRKGLVQTRQQAQAKGMSIVKAGAQAESPLDIIVNVNEVDLSREAEEMEKTLGVLDGQLSLKNATVMITLP